MRLLRDFISILRGERVWYVRYPDGVRSVEMSHDVAGGYRDVFGGTLHRKTRP